MRLYATWDTASNTPTWIRTADTGYADKVALKSVPGATEWLSYPPDPRTLGQLIQLCGKDRVDARLYAWYKWRISQDATLAEVAKLDDVASVADEVAWGHDLYRYQRVGALWLAIARRAILGDEVGLGKTIQSLTAARLLGSRTVLIITLNIAKRSVWEKHCREWLGVSPVVVEGDKPTRMRLLEQRGDVVIINHEMLRPKAGFPGIFDRTWDLVIVDEAHKLQGRSARVVNGQVKGSQQSAGADMLKSDAMFLLTGTPIWSDAESIWHLLKMLRPKQFSSYWRFVETFFDTVLTPWNREVVGVKPSMRDEFTTTLAPMMLRRTKRAMLPQLPDKIVQAIEYTPSATTRRAYDLIKRKRHLSTPTHDKYYQNAASAMADMRQLLNMPSAYGITDTAKDAALLELIDSVDGKVVVFTWHVAYADHVRTICAARGWKPGVITGSTSPRDRDANLTMFRDDPACKVMVGNIAAMGTAINDLVVASVAVFAEGAYVPALNEQAEGRLHRMGQKCDVMIYRLQAGSTVESAIWEVADERAGLADELLSFQAVARKVFGDNDNDEHDTTEQN